jgi:phosphohistidine phosphatase
VKRLLLLRHAKSSWDDPDLADRDRPLAPRGERAARAMGRHLAGRGLRPDGVLCSTALRATETLARVAAELELACEPVFDAGLYLASSEELLAAIRAAPDEIGTLLLVGHEPGLSDLACRLARPDSRDWRRMARKFPTGACAEIRTGAARWGEIADGCGLLESFTRPRQLD